MSTTPIDDEAIDRYLTAVEDVQRERFATLAAPELQAIARELGMDEATLVQADAAAQTSLARGQGYLRHALYDDAIRELRRAHALAPCSVAVEGALARAHLGRWQQKGAQADRVEAERLARLVIDRRAEDDDAYAVLRALQAGRRGMRRRVGIAVGVAAAVVAALVWLMVTPGNEAPSSAPAASASPAVSPAVERPDPVAPEPVAPEPVAPEPVAPEPVAPTVTPPAVAPPADLEGLARTTLAPRDGGIPVDWYAGGQRDGITVEIEGSQVQYGYYKLTGRLRLDGPFDLGPTNATLEIQTADGAIVGRTELAILETYQPRMLAGDTTTFDRMVEARLGEVVRARLITRSLDRQPITATPDAPRPLAVSAALPAGIGFALRERSRRLNPAWDNRRFLRIEFDVENTGERPIRRLKLNLALRQQGVEVERKGSWVVSSSSPPMLPGERRVGVFLAQVGDFDAEELTVDGDVE